MSRVDHKTVPAQVEPLLVDVKALGRLLSLSVRSVRRLNSGGKVPRPVRVGRSVRWNVETIREWIAQGCPEEARCKDEARSLAEKGGNRKHVA